VCLWADAVKKSEPPGEADIVKTLPLVGHNALLLDPHKMTAGLERAGQSVDLGGVGKGYAADKVLDVFRSYGISSAFVNLGGNVAAMGAKPDGSQWHIGIRHPREENSLVGVVSVADRSVVTSGDYQRYFIGKDGKRYHHILDPYTGYQAESGLASATVVANGSAAADALSTALFVAGMQKGVGFLDSFPGAEAVFVGQDLSVYATKGLQGSFEAKKDINVEWI
jgi:thiamine biosynthesis lipoprotein